MTRRHVGVKAGYMRGALEITGDHAARANAVIVREL
jgi:hypothetical protein